MAQTSQCEAEEIAMDSPSPRTLDHQQKDGTQSCASTACEAEHIVALQRAGSHKRDSFLSLHLLTNHRLQRPFGPADANKGRVRLSKPETDISPLPRSTHRVFPTALLSVFDDDDDTSVASACG